MLTAHPIKGWRDRSPVNTFINEYKRKSLYVQYSQAFLMEAISWLVVLLLLHIGNAGVLRNDAKMDFSTFKGL